MVRKADDCDYEVVKAKVPKRDKEGNDISADKMGTGGRRREDGTLSALAYDLELIEESDDSGPNDVDESLWRYAWEDQRMKAELANDFSEMLNNICAIADAITNFLEDHPDVAVKIADGVVTFGHTVAGQFRAIKTKLTPKKSNKKGSLKKKLPPKRATAQAVATGEKLPEQSKRITHEQRTTMTVEEARHEVLNILGHYIEIKKGIQRLINAGVIDPQRMGFNEVIIYLEEVVQKYPSLMDKTTEAYIQGFNLDEQERTRINEALKAGNDRPKEEGKTLPTMPPLTF